MIKSLMNVAYSTSQNLFLSSLRFVDNFTARCQSMLGWLGPHPLIPPTLNFPAATHDEPLLLLVLGNAFSCEIFLFKMIIFLKFSLIATCSFYFQTRPRLTQVSLALALSLLALGKVLMSMKNRPISSQFELESRFGTSL